MMNRFTKGLLLEIVGLAFIVMGVLCFAVIFGAYAGLPGPSFVITILCFVPSVMLPPLGVSLFNRGRKLRIRLAEEVLSRGLPYVFYLRASGSRVALI
jgi:hypothetical protein